MSSLTEQVLLERMARRMQDEIPNAAPCDYYERAREYIHMVRAHDSRPIEQQTLTEILKIAVPRAKSNEIITQRDAQHDFQQIVDLCVTAKANAKHDGVSP